MRPEKPSDPARKHLDLDRGQAAYTDEGSGPVVLALHGCPGSVMDWRWLGVPLEGSARLIRVELPGFGQTPIAVGPRADMVGRALWVLEFMDALGLEECILIAHSAGGLIALELAARYPDRVRGLALVAAPGGRPHKPIRDYPNARWFSRLLRVPIIKGYLTWILRKGFEQAGFPKDLPPQTVQQTMHVVAHMDFERQASNIDLITSPCFLAWAADDAFIELDISEELAEQLPPGPRLGFPEGGHYIQKTQAVEIGAAFNQWINSLDVSPPEN